MQLTSQMRLAGLTEREKKSWNAERDSRNPMIHLLYTRQEYDDCLKLIDAVLKDCRGQSEYPIFVKALIKRQQGLINESLQLFQAATVLSPTSISNLKQVARSLYLLGKHTQAIQVYEECEAYEQGRKDWEVHHNKGLCFVYLKVYEQAIECFRRANSLHKHDATYMHLGKVYTIMERYEEAINAYVEGLEHSPENPDLLSTVGMLYLRMGDNTQAFDYLGNALTHDPKDPKCILAAGSIIQDHNDVDVALIKYRVAAVVTPNSAQLWNNIGMCFFNKRRFVAAAACLKRALYLDPFEWIVSYNLGLIHLNTGQYASAFHYLSASINLKPDFPSTYMYLGVTLARLNDVENACHAYEKAISMEQDHMFELNYAITLFNNEMDEPAKEHFREFLRLFSELDEESQAADQEVLERTKELKAFYGLEDYSPPSASNESTPSNGNLNTPYAPTAFSTFTVNRSKQSPAKKPSRSHA